jgi:hypothetical protein
LAASALDRPGAAMAAADAANRVRRVILDIVVLPFTRNVRSLALRPS